MKIGAMLGPGQHGELAKNIARAERREAERKRQAEFNRKKREGKTVKYRRPE